MNKEEFRKLDLVGKEFNSVNPVEYMKSNLINQEDRTLLYGYTCDRDTFHVYMCNGNIVKVIYRRGEEPIEYTVNSFEDFVPNKRVYPSASDYEFCMLLKKLGIHISFTTEDDREQTQFYGEILS